MGQARQTAPEGADLIGHLQEVKDVHFRGRVISTSQQGMEVWDRRGNTLFVDHIIQVSVGIEGQKAGLPTGNGDLLPTKRCGEA